MRVGVDKKSDVRYPRVIPPVVDTKLGDDRKSAVANSRWSPPVVERRFREEMKSDVKYPRVIPAVVEMIDDVNDKLETYPAVPKPATVEFMLIIFIPPGPNAVENDDIASLIDE